MITKTQIKEALKDYKGSVETYDQLVATVMEHYGFEVDRDNLVHFVLCPEDYLDDEEIRNRLGQLGFFKNDSRY